MKKKSIPHPAGTSSRLAVYASLLTDWHEVVGEFDFIRAKAKLAMDIKGEYPLHLGQSRYSSRGGIYPLLYLYNQRTGKPTIPLTLTLDDTKNTRYQRAECRWQNSSDENRRLTANDGAEWFAGTRSSILPLWYFQTTDDSYWRYTKYRV